MIASGAAHTMDQYIRDVVDGNILVCKFVRNAVQRHLDDLKRQGDKDFPYHFDVDEASAAIDFFPAFLNHSIGDYAGLPFYLEPWQAFSVGNIFGWKRSEDNSRRFRKVFWSMARKQGKALTLDTILPTPTGFTTMGEVQPGDYLIGPDGFPVLVEAATEVMENRPCYRMEFSTGEVVYCDEQHEWETAARVVNVGAVTRGPSGSRKNEPSIKTTRQIADTVTYGKRNDRNHRIGICKWVDLDAQQYEIEPYTLGAWLGDGHSASNRITNGYKDVAIIERIRADGYIVEERRSPNEGSGLYAVKGLGAALRRAGVLNNKHIPHRYLRGSADQRWDLLRGLMDTDGFISKAGQCEYTSINKRLAEDVHELICTLGMKPTLYEEDAKLNGRVVSKKYRVRFYAFEPQQPFCLKRKAARVNPQADKRPRSRTRQIVSCERVASRPVRCVQVQGGMYCCTRSFIPTHNSTVAAGIAIRLAALDINPKTLSIESVAEIILCATKREQADVIYKEIVRMREQSPWIKAKSESINKQITFTHNMGSIRTVGSDKSFDGLNPLCVIRDETHAWGERNRKFLDTMLTGSGSRSQPLDLSVTTAGDDQSVIWLEEYKYAKQVVEQQVSDNSLYAICYELDEKDDPLEEELWIKANPNLHVSLKLDYLREQARPARTSKLALNRFDRFHANRLVSSTERAFDLDQWDECKGELSDWKDADVIGGGVDLGGRDDLAAWALVARFPVDLSDEENPVWRYEVRTQSYIASDTQRDLKKPPFAEWCYTDLLRTTKYPVNELTRDLIDACRVHQVRDVAFDAHAAQPLAEELEQNGIKAAAMSQTTAYFHEPLTEFRQTIADGRLTHDGNPVMRWCVGNALAIQNTASKWMLNKRDSNDKIDPLVASVMAFWRAMAAPRRATGKMFIY